MKTLTQQKIMQSFKAYILFFFGLFLFAIQFNIFAQDISGNTLYMQNLYGINPAYAGSSDGILGTLQSKSQFSGLEDAPRTYMFSAHSPLPQNIGVGALIISDERGAFQYTSGELSASYKVDLTTKDVLRFGISGGFLKNSINNSRINTNQYVDPTDPTLSSNLYNKTSFRFRTGLWYQHENLNFSLSFPTLLVDGQKFHEHMINMLSYSFYFSQTKDWLLQPAVMYQILPYSPDQVEVNLMTQWKNMLWLQLGYRSNNSALVSAGFNISGIRIGYGYETASKELSTISNGSHEILLAINVPFKKDKKIASVEDANLIEEVSSNESRDIEDEKIKAMEEEIAILRKQLGQEVENLELKEIDTASSGLNQYYSLTVDQDGNEKKEAITPGNYIVVNTCTNNEFAHYLVKIYKKKDIDAAVVYDNNKKYYYIHTEKIMDFNEAVVKMKEKRKSGFKNAWVLVYKE